ncbi:tumor necrosis factor receptor superfamily member 9a [Electrophorus electricus]|uniref:tumor necrosis factor receptor superfamily member 9a n=1 Tax=Electrophorus electricus TaxID=8005 RepID=UPI0015D051DD|nr:tumor necrosis factor receptor superfamily member 9a [Electrophorus electricus]
MQLIIFLLSLFLLISSLLYISEGVAAGCEDWTLHGSKDVCCRKCKPGNRLVTLCGPDPSQFCMPCEPRHYTTEPMSPYCTICTQCTGKLIFRRMSFNMTTHEEPLSLAIPLISHAYTTYPQVEVQACTASSDTKCGCRPGLRCGDKQCTFCVDECKIGEEPTPQRVCRKCPEGKFNDQIHSACKPWRKSCPEGQTLEASGNASSDNRCKSVPQPSASTHRNQISTVSTLHVRIPHKDESTWLQVIGVIFGFSGVFSLFLCLMYLRQKAKEETKEPIAETFPQGELTIMMVERDETCSYHQPEQEQGGSSESISTQDSDSKLIV